MRFSLHIVDCVFGLPAAGVEVRLRRQDGGEWLGVTRSVTDDEGQMSDWPDVQHQTGVYQLEVNIAGYYSTLGISPLIPRVIVELLVTDPSIDLNLGLLMTASSSQIYQAASTSAERLPGFSVSLHP